MDPAAEHVRSHFFEQGIRIAYIAVSHLVEALRILNDQMMEGQIGKVLGDLYLRNFEYEPRDLENPRVIIVFGVPQPAYRCSFVYRGKKLAALIPPTYLHADRIRGGLKAELEQVLAPYGFQTKPIYLSQKLLAVRSGLARYGKNNVAYVEGAGSFVRIQTFLTDMPAEDQWREWRALDRCADCRVCTDNCPTGAIGEERFLIDAERCITFHNEQAHKIPFPDWIDPSRHNCLVGCLECQTCCPENADALRIVEGAEFNEEETHLLLRGLAPSELPQNLRTKLIEHDMLGFVETLPRNLPVLAR